LAAAKAPSLLLTMQIRPRDLANHLGISKKFMEVNNRTRFGASVTWLLNSQFLLKFEMEENLLSVFAHIYETLI
jgi:hypothetical protein